MLFLLFLLIPAVICQQSRHYGYSRRTLLNITGLPTNLVYNPNNDDLYFTLIDLESLETDSVQTKMDQYILRANKTIKINDINGQAMAIDLQNEKVYIASDDGIYTLDSSDKTQYFSNKGDDIVQLYKSNTNNQLYAVLHPDNEVYAIDLENKEKKKVKNIPCAYIFAVDENENIYYECEPREVKMLLKGFQESIQIAGIPKNNGRVIAVDNFNRVILAANDGLYVLRPNNVIPTKLMDLDYVPVGLAFDGDIIVSTNGAIYKYTKKFSEYDTEVY